MGSSKKHKKEKTRKHKHSSPSRDDEKEDNYSPEEKRRRHDDDDEHSKPKKHKRRHKKHSERDRDHSTDSSRHQHEEPTERNGSSSQDTESMTTPKGDGASLSIEETNNLRLKLGLKPLEIDNGSGNAGGGVKEEFVHAPAEDLWEKKKQEDIREKLRAIKEKRTLNKKMGKLKALGEVDEDEMDAGSWVERSRISEQKKKAAEKREKEIAEMDAEFGISGLIKKEFRDVKKEAYTSRDLKGMTVKHSLEMFTEGKSVILTLEDKGILDDDNDDTLVGANMIDAENTKRNLDIKTKGSGYKAYEEEEVDQLGFYKSKSLLSKYDEEIDGISKDQFTIGAHGKVDTTWEQQKVLMKKEIQAKGVSLALPELKIASEYLTEEEMTKFKKRKKKVRKVRKREVFKPDDLLPLPGSSTSSDLGSRNRSQQGNIPGWDEGVESAKVDDTSITSTTLINNNSKSVIIDEDDASNELQKALDKARRAKFVKANMVSEDIGAIRVVQHLEELSKIKSENLVAGYSTTISLNSTDEFCRQLGTASDLNTIKEEVTQDATVDVVDMDVDDNEDEETTGWNFVNNENKEQDAPTMDTEDGHAPIEAEPLAIGGLAGALKLAGRKGYLVEELSKGSITVTNQNSALLSTNYSIEDKNAVDHLDKYAHEKYSKDRNNRHDRGMTMDFEEKKNYKPKIKIEYVDEGGRLMNPKEAFRKLSHRFHGKGSGKMKLEKRQKKRGEEDMMMKMSSTDTPLNTVAMMKAKLRSEASPYIVLSGAGKTFQAGGVGSMAKK